MVDFINKFNTLDIFLHSARMNEWFMGLFSCTGFIPGKLDIPNQCD